MTAQIVDRCACGGKYRRRVRIGGRIVWYWCDNCDSHGQGCSTRRHKPGRCAYPTTS